MPNGFNSYLKPAVKRHTKQYKKITGKMNYKKDYSSYKNLYAVRILL